MFIWGDVYYFTNSFCKKYGKNSDTLAKVVNCIYLQNFSIPSSLYLLLHMMYKYRFQIIYIYIIIGIIINSSFCVFNFKLPACTPNFVPVFCNTLNVLQAWFSRNLSTFRRNLLPPSSGSCQIKYFLRLPYLSILNIPTNLSRFSPRIPGFDPGSVHVGFVVEKVALGQVFHCQFHSTGAPLHGNTKK
jgi:hypothetical protein